MANRPSYGWAGLLSLAAALFVPSCGGGGGDKTPTAPPPPVMVLTTVAVSLSAPTIQVGQTATASATGADQNGGSISTGTVTWSSSAPSIATITSGGSINAVAVGQTTVTATAGSKSGQATLTVIPVPVASVVISPTVPAVMFVGATQQLTAATLDANGVALSGRSVTWSSSDTTKATVSSSGLVTALSAGAATITATSEGKPGTASITVIPVPVATVTVTPASATLGAGLTQQLTATTKDANGATLTGRVVSWSSSDPSKATVSTTGLVTAVAVGATIITATSEGKSGSAQVTVSASSLVISSIAPSVLQEGSAATITGVGFTSVPSVTIAGFAATVTAWTSSQIQVTVPRRDCQPQKMETVSVTVAGNAVSSSAPVKGTDPTALNAGYFMWSGSDQCLQLAAAPAGAKYVVGILSTSATPSEVTVSQLFTSVATSAAVSSAMYAGSSLRQLASRPTLEPSFSGMMRRQVSPAGILPSQEYARDWAAEQKFRESEEMLARSKAPAAARQWLSERASARGLRALSQASLVVGDTTTLTVQGATPSFTSAPTVRAVVRYVGADNIWLEDVANPTVSFTTAEYQAMESFYSTNTKPVLASYAGPFTDIDVNQHNLILITKEVNKQSGLLGFVWGGDLYPRSVIATSNQAEIFYGLAPDSAGTFGTARSKSFVSGTYRSLMAHELTHVIQAGQGIYGSAGVKAGWEREGGATLSEQLVGFRVYGYSSGQNLGLTAYRGDSEWFQNWVIDLAVYFGFSSASSRIQGAPEQCTWVGRPSDGNSGPCLNANRAIYGVPATLLRFVLDKYGAGYPGGESALMRNIVASPNEGYASLTVPTGVPTNELLTRFSLMLWSDGKTSNPLTSWNLYDIWSGFVATAQLAPYTSTSQQPTLQASVRAGSTAYLEWSPTSATLASSLRVRSPSGAAVPSTMVLWMYRYQ